MSPAHPERRTLVAQAGSGTEASGAFHGHLTDARLLESGESMSANES
jgi:hypothetical protein